MTGPVGAAALVRRALSRARSRRRGVLAPRAHRGDGFEFAELRAYAPGDDLRRIDWAATARAGVAQTRVVFEERGLLLAVCVDASPSMQLGRDESLYDRACAAAHVWFSAASGDDRCVRINGERLPPVLTRASSAISRAAHSDANTLHAGLAAIVAGLPADACVLVVSDFFELDAVEELLRRCVQRHHVIALVVRDPWHDGLPLRGFVTLRDAETSAVLRTFIGARQRADYLRASAAREEDICARLARCGIGVAFLEGDPQGSVLQALGCS